MCKMITVINELRLGNRLLGYECWSGKDVVEFTENQLRNIITSGKQRVCGLKVGKSGVLELDKEGFYTTNMTVHTHINNYETIENSVSNVLYVCVGSSIESGKEIYHCISSRFEQAVFNEEEMKAYLKIGLVSGGAKLEDDRIVLATVEAENEVKVEEPAKETKPEKVEEPAKETKPAKKPSKTPVTKKE